MPDDKKADRDEAKAREQVEAEKKAAAEEIDRAKADAEARARAKQALAEREKEIDRLAADEAKAEVAPSGVYGPFADHPQKFVVRAELLGTHPRGSTITYRDLMAYRDPKERTKPHVGGTRANADRLIAAGHITPLVILPE